MSNKSLMINFGANILGFSKGVNQMKSELTELNVEMMQNKKKQKEVNSEVKELEKQLKALKTAMSQTKTPTKEMTDEADRLQKALDKATLQSAQLKTEEQELKGKISATTKELQDQNTAADKNAISMEKVGEVLKKAVSFTATGMGALFTYTAKMAATSDEINTMAKQTGLATDEIQKFMYASELIDVSLDTLTGSMSKLIRNMNAASKGSGDAYEAFKALGVSVKDDVTGVLRDNQDVFDEVISKLGTIEDTTQRDAYAMAIFGKSAQELNPLILGGTQQLKEFGDELQREGLILDQLQLDKLNEFNDKIDAFKAKFQAKMMESSVDWIGAFDDLLEKSDEIVDMVATLITGFAKVTGFVVDHKEAVISLVTAYGAFKTVMNIGNLIESVVKATKSLTTATQAATVAQKGMNAAVNAHPYTLLASVLASVVVGFITYGSAVNSAEKSTEEFISATERLRGSIDEKISSTQADLEILRLKGEKYEELRKKTNLTAQEELNLYNIASELEQAYPNQISLIDNKTASYKALGEQIEVLTENMLANARTAALQEALVQAYKDKATDEAEIAKNQAAYDEVKNSTVYDYISIGHYIAAMFSSVYTPEKFAGEARESALNSAKEELERAEGEYADLLDFIEKTESELRSVMGSSYTGTLEAASTTTQNFASQVTALSSAYALLNDAESELSESHNLSAETLQKLVTKYPALQNVVNDYLSGIASGEDVIRRLSMAYEADVKNNGSAIQQKMNTDAEYYQKLMEMNDSYINELASEYGIDLSNYHSYTEAKLAIEKEFLSTKAKNWATYYDAEGQRYRVTDKDIIQYKKELQLAGYSPDEIKKELEKYGFYMHEYYATQNAVNAWNSIENKLDDNLVDYSKYYIAQTVGSGTTSSGSSSGGSGSSSGSSKKEISIYEQARASYNKIINDRIDEVKKLTDAEVAGADERIAAINAEIEARKKLSDTEDLQKRIDFIKGQLKYSQLDDFERHELTKQLASLEKEQEDTAWEEAKRAEIEAIEAEKEAAKKAEDEVIADLQNRLSYSNTLFTDLQNGYKAATTIANDNSKSANITIVEQALTKAQVKEIVRETLGIEEVF